MGLETIGAVCSSLVIRIATPLAFFAMHSRENVALAASDKRIRQIVSSQDDAVAVAQCTNICISTPPPPPTSNLRTSIRLLASVSLAPHRKYTTRATNWQDNASGAALRMDKPQSKTPQLKECVYRMSFSVNCIKTYLRMIWSTFS